MRVPHTICINTYTAYKPSAETVGLVAEVDRVLKAEHEIWDTGLAPTLVSVCVKSLVDNFKEKQVLSELPSEDRDLLYETLSPDLPLPITVPLLTDDIYWQRCAISRWTSGNYAKEYDSSWKRLYLERHIQDYLETLQVADFVLKDVTDLMTLCSPHVRRLKLRQLQISKAEPLDEEGDECTVEEAPCEHINLEHVIASLANLQELDLMFGLRDCGMDFSWTLFQFSIKDCNNLGRGLEHCTHLKKLRIHRSTLDDIRLITLLQYIARNTTLRVLDFSHCKITDVGAMALGKVLTVHPTLATINLCVNKIRSKGAEGLAYALAHSRSPVDSLNLRLNVIGDAGAIALSSALAHSTRPRELILAACGIKEDGAIKLGQALQQNMTLKHLDLSNNDLGDYSLFHSVPLDVQLLSEVEDYVVGNTASLIKLVLQKGGEAMELGLQMNTTIEHLDLRKTNILAHYDLSVSEMIFRNQEIHKKEKMTPQCGDRFHGAQSSTLLSVLERCLPPTSEHWSPRTTTNIEPTLPQCVLCKEASDRRKVEVFPAIDCQTTHANEVLTRDDQALLPQSVRPIGREEWNSGKNEDYPLEDQASALPHNGRAVCRKEWNTEKNEDYPLEDQAAVRAVCREEWNTGKNEVVPLEDKASALPHHGRAVCKTEWALGKPEVHQLRVGRDAYHGVRGSSRWYTDAALPITNPRRPLRITLSTGLPSPASLMPRPQASQVDHVFNCLALDMCSQKSKSHGSGLGEAKKYGLPLPSEAPGEMATRPNYSKKVFIGGLPPDIDCDEIGASFARFGALQVGWPHKNESRSVNPPKGFAFLQFDSAESVHLLVKHCQLTDNGGYFILVSSNAMKDKAVQVRPWIKDDADFMIDQHKIVDRNTVFVGGVPRPLTACQLAQVMSAMFGPVCYAGVDIDPDLGYPKGAGRVIFSCQASCIAAISSRFVKLNVGDMKKSIEVKAFVLQDQDCDGCKGHLCVNKPAAFFCSNVGCLKYYCALCWAKVHEQPGKQYHKPTHQKTTSSIF